MNQYKIKILLTFLRKNILKNFFFRRMHPYEVLKGMCLETLIIKALRGKKMVKNINIFLKEIKLQEPSFSLKICFIFILRVLN